MKKYHIALAGLIVLTIFISACQALPGGKNDLDGTAWILTHINGNPILPDTRPTLYFSSGQVSGHGSCNGFGGEYTQSGSTISFSNLISTLMACMPNEITQQETAYFSALSEAAEFMLENDSLMIFNSAGVQVLAFSAQDTSLEGKTWQMTAYSAGGSIQPVLEGSTVTARFEDGSVSGSAGCNHFGAPYTTKDGEIGIESAAVTEMYCETPAGVMDQEAAFLAALLQARTYRVQLDSLALYDQAGNLVVEFISLPLLED